LCSHSAPRAAYTGMQYRQIHDFFHDLFYSICISVKL
jgi:ubiquinone biosynthesis protein Coq4